MIKTCPIEIAFGANEKVTGLEIITSLDAADELADTAIKIIAGNVQVAVRPCSAEVGTDIESGPVVGRRYDWRCADGSFGGRSDARAEAPNNPAAARLARKSVFINAP
jgi:hypothetical protein